MFTSASCLQGKGMMQTYWLHGGNGHTLPEAFLRVIENDDVQL